MSGTEGSFSSMVRSLAFVLATLSLPAAAAAPDRWFAVTPVLGAHIRLDGWDLNESLTSLDEPSQIAPYIGLRLGGGPVWWVGLEAAIGAIIYQSEQDDTNVALQYDADVVFYLMKSDWAPLLLAGGGGYQNVAGDHKSDFDAQFHYGLGVRGLLTESLALRIEARHLMTDTSDKDASLANNVEVLVGLDVLFRSDTKPAPPADRDGDGVLDADDRCPDVRGPTALQGCPDADGDGLVDAEDKCPREAGTQKLAGCPDTDSDGIVDGQDKCPTVAGTAQFEGCADSDGDQISDGSDRCPTVAGPTALQGCPDGDGDGVPDVDDRCPTEKGPPALHGCEPQFDGALDGIQFARNSAEIDQSSAGVLDAVVEKLTRFVEVRVLIEGHTDSRGTPAYNQRLSEHRAKSVRDYLIAHGVAKGRVETRGYGEQRAVGDNETEDGRARNRRIEFHILGK